MDAAEPQLSPDEVDALFAHPGSLLAVVVQEAASHEVLMLAWMNRAALQRTISTRQATYWSRSRSEIWIKGATSGHTQEVVSLSLDCDADALLMKVHQSGVACHTGEMSCFHRPIEFPG